MNAALVARYLCRDAFGNGFAGQDERSLRYVALAIEELDALLAVLEDRHDSRKTNALEKLTRSMREDTHPAFAAFPEWEKDRMPPKEKWSGRDMPFPLQTTDDDALPPELQAALATAKPGAPVAFSMSGEQFAKALRDPVQ